MLESCFFHPLDLSSMVSGIIKATNLILWLSIASVLTSSTTSIPLVSAGGAVREPRAGGLASSAKPVALKLKLPFPAGYSFAVIQGNHGDYTHSGFNEYAWDFALPMNSPVCAAAAGRVVRVKQDGKDGGPSSEFFGEGNTIVIDHGEGYFSLYLHLAPDSSKVSEGSIVRGGEVIALSGNTGFSSTPHLHFHVQDSSGRSLPVSFLDVPGNGIPLPDTMVTSGNDGTGTSQYHGESYLPPDIFQSNNIQLITQNLPGHLYKSGREYRIKGKVSTVGTRQVAAYFMGVNGGKALYTIYGNVDRDGIFELSFDPAGLRTKVSDWNSSSSQSNLFSLAIAPIKKDGSFWSEVSVPVCIR